jgi:2-keto-4-pentenoate hydratase/2-oxohepta-3-ene-1,7-dioic acid hydratase in catechol pathway
LRIVFVSFTALVLCAFTFAQGSSTKYVRYSHGGQTSYGVLEGDNIRELDGDLFSSPQPTGKTVALADVKLLPPTDPSKVIAVGLNYKSHIGDRPTPEYPGLFAKFPTSLVGHGGDIVVPPDSKNLHYEGELVVVIGKKAQNVSVSDAPKYIFGVTAGNDISERDWQRADLQWVRAKASDTFGPVGPAIVTGLDYNDLLVQTRVNGEVRQKESSKDLVFGVDQIVSYVSKYVTLLPGDIIFTGTPQSTKAMKPGDVVEVEIEGVGILRNTVVSTDGK